MDNSNEGPSGSQFHGVLTENFRPGEPANEATAVVVDSPVDVTMTDDIDSGNAASVFTDYSYDSHRSESEYTDEDDDYDSNKELDYMLDSASQHINTSSDLGLAIAAVYNENKYDDGDQQDIFDEDSEGDESEDDSDASSNYEELSEPGVVLIEVVGPELEIDPGAHSSGTDSDDTYSSSEEEGTVASKPVMGEASAIVAAVPQVRHVLDGLISADLVQKKTEEKRDAHHWKLLELHESMRRIEREIAEEERQIQQAEDAVIKGQADVLTDIVGSGLSYDLFECYKDFRDSLHPQYGLREGFSIDCWSPHEGSYFQYDPEFELFKENVEMDYTTCNFRCEASIVSVYRHQANVVEFYPIRCPEPLTGLERTWGDQFPALYRLAMQAAKSGSEAAMEILLRLPDIDASMEGWLFEYTFENLLKDEPVISKRWVLKEARKIDKPSSREEKLARFQALIAA